MSIESLLRYENILFDCDGVILNSNSIKSDAFYASVLKYGDECAELLKKYHLQHGGVSRYEKFRYFFEEILKIAPIEEHMEEALHLYSTLVSDGLLTCEIASGLSQLRTLLADSNWLVVSGGDQAELRLIFQARDISHYFEGGIFGSPDPKEKIINREIQRKNISSNSLFLGDSKYDFEVAKVSGFDFIFVSQWSEVQDWGLWAAENEINSISGLSGLMDE